MTSESIKKRLAELNKRSDKTSEEFEKLKDRMDEFKKELHSYDKK